MASSTSQLSLRILLISTGVLSAATAMKFSFPLLLNFAVSDVPLIWSVILSWLRPPYLYVVINGIIITIVASSRFQYHYNHYHNDSQIHSPTLLHETNSIPIEDLPPVLQPMSVQPSLIHTFEIEHPSMSIPYVIENTEAEENLVVYEIEPPVIDIETVAVDDSGFGNVESEDKFIVSRSTQNSSDQLLLNSPTEEIVQSVFALPVKEKPLLSSRFAHQRRVAKINPEGVRSLRVTKPRKHETLESTWRTITDGRHIPLNRHLRKPDTSEINHHHHAPPLDAYSGEEGPALEAADDHTTTPINDRSDHQNRVTLSSKNSLPKLRKEGSLSHDELNRRVEAFIKKFNDEMRLQRQESMKRYMDMINRGAE